MDSILIIVHLVVAAALIGLVLLQQGKGADMGAAFGSGASSTVFGSQGSANFLSRTTALLATIFFITSLSLAYFSNTGGKATSVVDRIEAPVVTDAPAIPEVPGDSATMEETPVIPADTSSPDAPPQ